MLRRQRAKDESTAPRKRTRLGRIALFATGSLVLALALVWYAVHHFDWAGPLVANSLRAVLGDERVARLEDFVYGAEDGVNRVLKRHAPPKSYWQVPDANSVASAAPPASSAASAAAKPAESNEFDLQNVGPALKEWSAAGDGDWVAVKDPRHAEEAPRIFKTLLHPDKERSWAEVFVVAID
ncbi:MAG TPA: hypothetical protein VGM44_20440, partial [Polyangiaceae bacterium]